MSLYTFSHSDKITSVKIPAGLRMEESTGIRTLSIIDNSTNEDVIFIHGLVIFESSDNQITGMY